jgi:hypothetical protein
VIQPDKTAAQGADPQHPGATFVQGGYAKAAQTRQIRQAESCEALSIKAGQTTVCAGPHIAVVVLQQRIDRVLWQTMLRLPNRSYVLLWIGLSVNGSDDETGQETRGKSNYDPTLPSMRRDRMNNRVAMHPRCADGRRDAPGPPVVCQRLVRDSSFSSELSWTQTRLLIVNDALGSAVASS